MTTRVRFTTLYIVLVRNNGRDPWRTVMSGDRGELSGAATLRKGLQILAWCRQGSFYEARLDVYRSVGTVVKARRRR